MQKTRRAIMLFSLSTFFVWVTKGNGFVRVNDKRIKGLGLNGVVTYLGDYSMWSRP